MDVLVGIVDEEDDDEDTFVGGVDAAETVDVDDKFSPLISDGEFCCCVAVDEFLYWWLWRSDWLAADEFWWILYDSSGDTLQSLCVEISELHSLGKELKRINEDWNFFKLKSIENYDSLIETI